MSLPGFEDILRGPFQQYLSISSALGGDVANHAALVKDAFQAQLDFLRVAASRAKPSDAELSKLLTPTSQKIQSIQDYREKNRASPFFNHLSAVSESISALGWVAVSPAPAPYIKEVKDAAQFYTNRVLKDWKENKIGQHLEAAGATNADVKDMDSLSLSNTKRKALRGRSRIKRVGELSSSAVKVKTKAKVHLLRLYLTDLSYITIQRVFVWRDSFTRKRLMITWQVDPLLDRSYRLAKLSSAIYKDKRHVDWANSWVQTLTDLQAYVKQYHTTGVVWSGKGGAPSGVPPPPPGGMPPPPPVMPVGDFADLSLDPSQDRSALFAQINQGENITRSLKKVTSDMQTHKNPSLRAGPAPFKAPSESSLPSRTAPVAPTAAQLDKPPNFSRDGKKWLIEYQKGNHNLVVEGAEMNNVVYIFKCVDSAIRIKGKVNSVVMDSCRKSAVVFDSLVSSAEFVNCQSVQMQVFGVVPTITIDKTDGCHMYLNDQTLNVEIVSSKSSEMNVLIPTPSGDFNEFPIPEQYKTTVSKQGLTTIAVESMG